MLHTEKKILSILIIFMLICCGIGILIDNRIKEHDRLIQYGCLDLSKWDEEKILALSGNWDFYWNKLLDENSLSQNPKPDLKAKVPSVWNRFTVDGVKLEGMGYATYRLHVTGAEAGSLLAMRLPTASTAYDLYIDNELLASSGNVSTSQEGFLPQYKVKTVVFTAENESFDIILHVANFVYARGGAWYSIFLGTPEKITDMDKVIFGMDFFTAGFSLLLALYSVFLFCLRKDKGELLLLALSIIFIGRIIIKGDYLINSFFPTERFRLIVLIDYITLYWLPSLALLLVRYMYSDDISMRPIKILIYYGAIMTALTLILPVKIFTNFIYAADAVAFCAGVYGVVKLILLAVKHKPEAMFMLIGAITLTICISHDVLHENNIIQTGFTEYSPFGFLILTSLLQCIFWIRYERSNRDNERMLLELNEANKREQSLELQFLKSQIRPHFINNALNAVIAISRTDADKSRKLLIEFSKYLWNCYGVQNLEDKVPIENELSFVRAYVALEQARFSDSLHVDYEIDKLFLMIPPLTLQPLVENAIIHGVKDKNEDGHINIYVKDYGSFIKVGVMDDGVGISEEQISMLLSSEHRGTGVGIYNINRRIKRLYNTELHIENHPKGGINAYFIVGKD